MSLSITETCVGIESAQVPTELVALKGRIAGQPEKVRAELEPLIDEVLEHAMFRSRVMLIAREALRRLRVDVAALRFDLEATRRETGEAIVLSDRSPGKAQSRDGTRQRGLGTSITRG